MTAIITPVSRNFICDTEIRQLGEDFAQVAQFNAAYHNIRAKLELMEATASSPETRARAYEMRCAFEDVLADASWQAHSAACELSVEEALVKPMKMEAA